MTEWIPVAVALLGGGGLVSVVIRGIGKWIKWRRDDKLADLATIKDLQHEVKAMLQDRIKDEMNRRQEAEVSNKLQLEMITLLRAAQKEREASQKGPA